jgi:AcrR family transcriptional regulator
MDDLARELGMSKKTLYAHFPGKTALVEAALRDKLKDAEGDLQRATSDSVSDFPGALHRLLACVRRHMGEIQPPFLRDILREAPDLFKLVEVRRREMIQRHVGKLLDEGRRAEIIRRDVPIELLVEILLGAVQAIMNPPKLEELGLTPGLGLTAILTVIFEGAVTEKGRLKLWPARR